MAGDDITSPLGASAEDGPAPVPGAAPQPVPARASDDELVSDPFAALLGLDDAAGGSTSSTDKHDAPVAGDQPLSRREARAAAHHHGGRRQRDQGQRPRTRWWRVLLGILIGLAVIVGLAAAAFFIFKDDIVRLVSGADSTEYPGPGSGQVIVVIDSGDYGDVIADKLEAADVVKSAQSFYRYLLEQPESPTFQPGSYQLKLQMTNADALAALLDTENRMDHTVVIPEGYSVDQIFERLVAVGFDGDELTALRAEPGSFGLPEQATDLEGFLFPATYTFDATATARDAVQTMVDRMMQSLDALGVSEEDRYSTVIMASIVQREAGPDLTDMPKIARVFQNRLDIGMRLQSDATVAYGTGNTHTVWTTAEEREDASNLYNTYANDGLPIGPISNPGDDALSAAVHPADGDWIYFMVVNLSTGETVFSVDAAGHDAAVQQLADWCNASEENRARCDQ